MYDGTKKEPSKPNHHYVKGIWVTTVEVKVLTGSVFGIVTAYGLDDGGVGVRVLVGSRIFTSLYHLDWLGVHPTSYQMGTGGSFPGGKAAGAYS
jgi:hypothetical protein